MPPHRVRGNFCSSSSLYIEISMRQFLRAPCGPGQALLTGHPAALLTDNGAASTVAATSIPRAQLDADFYFGEKQPSLHQMEGNGQFPRHVLLLPATLAARLGIPIRPGLRGEGTPSLPQPATSGLGGHSTGRRVWSPGLQSTLALLTSQTCDLGQVIPFLGPQWPQL